MKWSTSLFNDSVVLIGFLIVVTGIVRNDFSGIVDVSLVVVGGVLVYLGAVAFSSTVNGGAVFVAVVADGLTSL